jgi:hypothetical protein
MFHSCIAAVCLALILQVTGCASGPRAVGVSQAKLEADYADCESMSYVSTAGIRAEGSADEERQKLIDACMRHKGYTFQ